MSHNQRIGKWGEDTAAEHLTQRGHEIIARNVRTPYGEIDIVAKQNDVTIFVEVKTRWQKRLEKAKFPLHKKHADEVVYLTPEQFVWLLDGYDVWKMRLFETLHFDRVC